MMIPSIQRYLLLIIIIISCRCSLYWTAAAFTSTWLQRNKPSLDRNQHPSPSPPPHNNKNNNNKKEKDVLRMSAPVHNDNNNNDDDYNNNVEVEVEVDKEEEDSILRTTSRRSFITQTIPLLSFTLPPTAAFAATSSSIPSVGASAPKFSLPSSRGDRAVTLESLTTKGMWTVMYFYPGAFTNGCTLEARGFQQDIREYERRKTQIVGVSVDSVEKNAQFCSSEGLDFVLLSDLGGKVSKAYGSALSIPGFGTFSNRQTYIIDPSGNLRWVFTDVESHVPRHSAEVLEKLQELQSV